METLENRLETLAVSPEVLVFCKPRGISSVSLRPDDISAITLAIAAHPDLAALHTGAPGRPNEHGLLHRLDRPTTGCLAFARTLDGYANLKKAWRQATKIYRAVVQDPNGVWQGLTERPDAPIRINTPLAHSAKSKLRMLVLDPERPGIARSIRGEPLAALTYVLAAERLSEHPDLIDLTVQIKTGVRHQIRAHLASLGTPLWRDPIYGHPTSEASAPFWLHAWKLGLPPISGIQTTVTAPLPADWPRSL